MARDVELESETGWNSQRRRVWIVSKKSPPSCLPEPELESMEAKGENEERRGLLLSSLLS